MSDRPLRVLQVSRVFHPNIGGIEKHVEWLSRALRKRGHTVDVVTLDRSFADGTSYPPYENLDGIHVWRVPFAGSTRYPLAPRVARFASRYDVVHVHAIDFLADWMVATRRWHGRPVVLSTHGGFFHTDFVRALKHAWFQTATRALVASVDALVYTSEQDRDLFRKITDRGVLLRSAVDLDPWLPLEPAPVEGAWVTTGRVDTHKGIANLLNALALVRDRDPRPFRAEIVGPEVVPGLVDGLVRQRDALGLGKRVVFRGKVPFEELKQAVRTAELGLFPSAYESFGLSVVEAMAAGVVPVLNDIPAFRYFIDEGKNGFLVDYADASRAAATILRARDLGAARPAVSAAARASSRQYGWDAVVGEVEALYREAIARR